MDIEITDEEADILQDYYFGHIALHDQDENGCELWMSNLDREEVNYYIAKENKENGK